MSGENSYVCLLAGFAVFLVRFRFEVRDSSYFLGITIGISAVFWTCFRTKDIAAKGVRKLQKTIKLSHRSAFTTLLFLKYTVNLFRVTGLDFAVPRTAELRRYNTCCFL